MRELVKTYHGASLAMKLENGFRRSISGSGYAGLFMNGFPPFRLKYSGSHRGIVMINDSGASSIDAVYYSLNKIDSPLVWIIWNDEANAPFEELDLAVLQKVKKIIVVGKSYFKIDYLFGNDLDVAEAESIDHAVAMALAAAGPGECVLFSPATGKIKGIKNKKQLFDLIEEKFKTRTG